MPEETKPETGASEETKPETKPETEGGGAATDLSAEVEKWKSLARKNEAQAKANAEAARKLTELEEQGKSESQKLTDKAAEAEKRAAEAEARALRLEVASDKGLTAAQAKRLVGATKEELEADADELLETFKPDGDKGSEKRPPGRPKEQLRGGGDPSEEPEETDPRKLAAQIPRT